MTPGVHCIIVAGQTASGKTSLAAALDEQQGYAHIRVRDALQSILGGGSWDRVRLQREGADLDRRTNGRWLLEYLLVRMDLGDRVVVDSGRTRRQVEPVLEAITGSRLVYLDAAEETRRHRYQLAATQDPLKATVAFDDAMDHETERIVRELRAMSHARVETDGLSVNQVLAECVSRL